MIWALAFYMGAAPVAVTTVEIVGLLETDRIKIESKAGSAMYGDVSFYVVDGDGSFWCSLENKAWWRKYTDAFTAAAASLPAAPNADFGSVKDGFVGSQGTGYCNASIESRDGVAFLTVSHNRACFGSAGCNKEVATVTLDQAKLAALAEAFTQAGRLRWGEKF